MPAPNPQRYRSQGRREGVDDTVLDSAVAAFERIRAVPDVSFVSVNKLTGLETEADCELAISVPFVAGTAPKNSQSCHQLVDLAPGNGAATINLEKLPGKVAGGVKDWFESLFGSSGGRQQDSTRALPDR